MNAIQQAILTSALTVVGAVILFTFSEFSRGLFIQPILRLRELLGDIVDKVIYFAADLTSGTQVTLERKKEISETLRALATQLRAKEQMLPIYRFWSFLRLAPSASAIDSCAKNLIGLSNSFHPEKNRYPPLAYEAEYEDNIQSIINIQRALKLKTTIIPEIKKKA